MVTEIVLPSRDEQIAEYLPAFIQGYCLAMLWANTYTEVGEVDPYAWQTPAADWAWQAFAPDDRSDIRSTCEDFVTANYLDLVGTLAPPEQSGHDFALTRNHHGAGFWDRGYGEIGTRLTAAAHVYGESNAWAYAPGATDADNFAHLDSRDS